MPVTCLRRVRIKLTDDLAFADADAGVLSMRTNTLILIGRVLFFHRVTVVEGPSLSIDLTTGGYDFDRQRMKTKPSPSMPYDRQDLPGAPSKRFSARP